MWRNHELDAQDSRLRSSSGIGRRARSLAALLAISSLAAGLAVVGVATEASAQVTSPDPLPVPARMPLSGTTSGDAAASCWEIKQTYPTSGDGVYWLRTDALVRPEQFYCDMTTDGGGWVMIGRGRDGWTFQDYGQSTSQRLAEAVSGPDAFAPAALSSQTIDALLGAGAVKDLPDGLRIRRAKNTDGSEWQELRWHFLDLGAWSWALDGGHRLASFSIDGKTGTGSNTKDSSTRMWGEVGSGNRSATNHNGWFTFPWSGHGRQAGFSYRGSIGGQRNDTSYLWEYNTENSALPFTQLFIRPTLSTGTPAAIADDGLAAETLTPMLDDRPEEIAGGVVGLNSLGDSETSLRAPVLDITSLGDRVYVGGKFSQVRDTSTGRLVNHSYLAAFDRSTGAWISSFRPQLDGTVWDLEVVDGRLIVAGQFTNIDSVPGTQGLAAIDPISGAVDPSWRASLSVGGTTTRPVAFAIDREGDSIYVGGNFTRIDGPNRSQGMGRLGKVSAATGDPDPAFRPNVDGVPFDIDAAGSTVQVVGRFNGINGAARRSVATVTASTGDMVPGQADEVWTTTNNSRRYQFAVLDLGDEIWNGGSEHDTQVYRAADHQFVRGHVTADQGGDTQVIELSGDKVMQGSHGNAWIYSDATAWPSVDNYTRTDVYNWLGMFDPVTHAYERDWVPGLGSAYTAGAWALDTDVDGCLWFGGDMLGGPYVNGQRQYLESFSKFCPRDVVAPTVPGGAAASIRSAGGVRVNWAPSTDNEPGFLGYEVLRNDRVISPLLYASSYVDPTGTPADRYFVRAVDPAGNRSATSPVMIPADKTRPSTPKDLAFSIGADQAVTLTWTASSDDIGVATYRIIQTGLEVQSLAGTETSAVIAGLARGTYWFQVQAVDAAGNQSFMTPSVEVAVGGADVSPPSVPTDLVVTGDPAGPSLTATWTASTDDVGVDAYAIYRNGLFVQTVPGDVTTVRLDVDFGDHYVRVAARDAAGNESAATPSTLTQIVPPPALDTKNPSTPRNLVATVQPNGSIDVSWSASRDNVGVAYYRVTRNNAEVVLVDSPATSVTITTLGPGTHFIAVQAFDLAGNSSWKTPTVTAVVPAPTTTTAPPTTAPPTTAPPTTAPPTTAPPTTAPPTTAPPIPDTSNPSTPRDLAATVLTDATIDVTWSASRDNVGVAYYRVTRNNVEVAIVPGSQTAVNVTTLGYGTHYIAVQAFDAAGNSSWRTPTVTAVVVPPPSADTSNPSTPRDLVATVQPNGSIDVSWSASRDNVGVAYYRVTRNNAEVVIVNSPDTSVNVTTLGSGTHFIAVQAFDAAGNSSWKTPTVTAVVP
jgi:chitodextrinase